MGVVAPRGLGQLLDDMRRRRQVGIAHAEVDDVGAAGPGARLQPVDLLEDIRRQPPHAVELAHRIPRPSLPASRSGLFLSVEIVPAPRICQSAGRIPDSSARALLRAFLDLFQGVLRRGSRPARPARSPLPPALAAGAEPPCPARSASSSLMILARSSAGSSVPFRLRRRHVDVREFAIRRRTPGAAAGLAAAATGCGDDRHGGDGDRLRRRPEPARRRGAAVPASRPPRPGLRAEPRRRRPRRRRAPFSTHRVASATGGSRNRLGVVCTHPPAPSSQTSNEDHAQREAPAGALAFLSAPPWCVG